MEGRKGGKKERADEAMKKRKRTVTKRKRKRVKEGKLLRNMNKIKKMSTEGSKK